MQNCRLADYWFQAISKRTKSSWITYYQTLTLILWGARVHACAHSSTWEFLGSKPKSQQDCIYVCMCASLKRMMIAHTKKRMQTWASAWMRILSCVSCVGTCIRSSMCLCIHLNKLCRVCVTRWVEMSVCLSFSMKKQVRKNKKKSKHRKTSNVDLDRSSQNT